MLYIFHVDSGRMMSFDMNLALETVQFLKDTIERHHAIPASSQVLLVSGGETLDAKSRVCSYTAGTDTNPIYMFSTNIDPKSSTNPWPSIDAGSIDTDSKKYLEMKKELDQCLELPATYNTVVRRAKLAQSIYDMGKEELSKCEMLVHEQHLQHQGWTAVIANMEDITVEFEKRTDNYYKRFEEHITRRNEYKFFLDDFDTDLDKLSQIPILSPLIQRAEDKPCHAFDDVYAEQSEAVQASEINSGSESDANSSTVASNPDVNAVNKTEDLKQKNALTLLQWISSSENQKSLKRMAENCTRELDMFDRKVMDDLRADIQKTIDCARREDMKEIKGLEERLRGLESLMCDARKIVQEQCELSTSFIQNQNRAANLGDTSILPDLCASHRSQLLVMLANHKKLRDIRARCSKAKDELSKNLHQRLKFVIKIENKMYEIDNTLLFYHRCLRRLQTHLGIIEQIHQAPYIYVQAVTEVVRRRIFSSAYLMWASDLACHLLSIYNEEVVRRQDFKHDFEGHFLSVLFPGIDDFPPKFATEAPSIFDSSLPNLSKDDLNELVNYLPEITEKIHLPNLDSVIDFFASRPLKSSTEKSLESEKPTDKGAPSNKNLLNVFYEKELESETDTEDYEKIGQTSTTKTTQQTTDLRNVSVDATMFSTEQCDNSTSTDQICTKECETLTEENYGTVKMETDRLRKVIFALCQTSNDAIVLLKEQINTLKTDADNEKLAMKLSLDDLSKSLTLLQDETKNHERELVQRLTVDHELEMNDLRKSLYTKDDEIATLRQEKQQLEQEKSEIISNFSNEKDTMQKSLDELKTKLANLESKLQEAQHDREMAVKEIKDKMQHEHRNEIESLRCKFKMITTTMERSPSDTSLEKIERPDMMDIMDHETIVNQMKKNFQDEKELAIKDALEKERQRLQQESMIKSSAGSPRSQTGSQEVLRRIIDEKERQLDTAREREQFLLKENMRLKDTIQSLTNTDLTESQVSIITEKLNDSLKENERLLKELEKEKTKRQKLLSASQNITGVTVNSCTKDDNVLVAYNSSHNQYAIVQDSSMLYFLHAESYKGLNLSTLHQNTVPEVCYCIGKVTEKEYCHAKKDENRYKVGKGTKFYRVKVRPRSPNRDMDRSTLERRRRREARDKQTESTIMERSRLDSSQYESAQPIMASTTTVSQLISSFAQTEVINLGASSSSHDMVDSGVDSQHNKSSDIFKERNISVTEEDEPLSLTDERFRYKSEEEDEIEREIVSDNVKRNDADEASGLVELESHATECTTDSDEYRSLETKDENTEL